MKNAKRIISAALALVLFLMLMPAGIVNAAEVQTGGYENGNGLDLNNMKDGAISATSLDIKALAAEVHPGFFYGDMTSVSVCADLRLVAAALQAEDYDAAGYSK